MGGKVRAHGESEEGYLVLEFSNHESVGLSSGGSKKLTKRGKNPGDLIEE